MSKYTIEIVPTLKVKAAVSALRSSPGTAQSEFCTPHNINSGPTTFPRTRHQINSPTVTVNGPLNSDQKTVTPPNELPVPWLMTASTTTAASIKDGGTSALTIQYKVLELAWRSGCTIRHSLLFANLL